MAREPGPAHVFKILLFIVLPFVAAVLIAFFLIYVPDRQTSIIDRNYRVLETAKRQFQGLFRGRMIAFKQFRQKEKKCSKKEQDDEILSLSLQGERELYLHLKENSECTMPIQEIWTPLQKLSVFDNVVLVAPEVKHQIFYQWESPHTIPIVNFKSLLESAPSTPQPQQVGTAEPTPSGARNPLDMQQFMQTGARKYLEVEQFGIAYYLFLIPVSLAQALPQGTQLVPESLQNLTLAGLVRQQHFTKETYKLSPTLLAGIGFVLLMTVLAWPLLRLLYLQSAERLRGLDVRVLIVSGMLAVSLFTFFLLYCFTDLVHHKIFDDDMKILGDQLEKNFGEELESMFRPLTVLKDGIKEVCGALRCKENKLPDTAITKKLDDKLREEWDHKLTKKLQAKLETSPDLLHISSLLWISGSGKWVNRWTPEPLKQALTWNLKPSQWVQERRTRPGRPTSQSRRYFTDAQAGLLRAFPRSSDKSNSMYFTLEVVQSQFTGDTTVAMAAPVNEKAYDSHVVAVGSQFPSLTKAILPPGLSFVVIDDTGEVLLHANATKVIESPGWRHR
jgi:hypothetical protein